MIKLTVINLVIVSLLVVMWGWDAAIASILSKPTSIIRNVVLYCGLWHSWSMFAPEPLRVNRRLIVRVKCGGELSDLNWSDFAEMTKFDAFLRERERKYQDNLLSGEMPFLSQALAEHLLQWFAHNDQYPDEIAIIRETTNIPDLGSSEQAQTKQDVVFVWRRLKDAENEQVNGA